MLRPGMDTRFLHIDCVYLTCFRHEFSVLASVLCYSSIRLHRAETLEQADFLLTVTGGTVLLSDVAFLDGTWRDALRVIPQTHPMVSVLVVAEPVDWPALVDAYALGACGAVWKPLEFSKTADSIRTVDEAARERALLARERPEALARIHSYQPE